MLSFLGLIFVFLFGFITGNLLNPIIVFAPKKNYRNVTELYCQNCGRKLKFYEHISIFSYIFLNGCCASCSRRLVYKNQYVIIINLVFYFLSYLFYGLTIFGILLDLFLTTLLALGIIQTRTGTLPLSLTITATVLALLTLIPKVDFIFGIEAKLYSALIAAVIYAMLFFSIKSKINEGIILISVSVILSIQNFVFALLIALLLLISKIIIFSRKSKSPSLHLVPFLTIGYIVSSLFGNLIF